MNDRSSLMRENVLESILVDPTILDSANWWFDVSWYGLLIAGAMTALAAFATVMFLFVQFWSSGVRDRHTEWRTSVLELQTAEAKRDTAEAQERIAQLNNETARLRDASLANAQAGRPNALAAGALRVTTERIALAQGLTTPTTTFSEAARSLSIIPKVNPFAGTRFDAIVTSSSIELGVLLGSLKAALNTAGWIEVNRSDEGMIKSSVGGASLITINVDTNKDPKLSEAAETLVSALNEEGIAAVVIPKTDTDPTNANVIHIVIGPKP
jgi:hypothetical protein